MKKLKPVLIVMFFAIISYTIVLSVRYLHANNKKVYTDKTSIHVSPMLVSKPDFDKEYYYDSLTWFITVRETFPFIKDSVVRVEREPTDSSYYKESRL